MFDRQSVGVGQRGFAHPRALISDMLQRFRFFSDGMATIMASSLALLAVLVGFWLRALRLDFQPLWFDEGYSLFFANNDFLTIASLTAADIHPPFYYALLHIWMAFAGPSDVSVRLFSVAIGTLAIPVIYTLGKRLFDKWLAALAALLLSISPFHIYYSQEVRMYALVTLLTLVSTWAFASIVAPGRTHHSIPKSRIRLTWLWAVYVATGSLALHTQYFAAFVPVAHLVFLVWQRRGTPRLVGDWMVAQLVVLLSFLPWAVYAGLQLTTYVGRKVSYESYAPLGLHDFVANFFAALAGGTERSDWWHWLATFVIILAALGIFGHLGLRNHHPVPDVSPGQREQSPSLPRDGALLCLLIVVVSIMAGWLVNQRLPFNPPRWERLYLFSLPYFALLLALGIRWLSRLRRSFGWLGLSFCLMLVIPPLATFYTSPRYEDDYRPLVSSASANGRPEDLVATVYPWQIGFFQSYYRGQWPTFALMSGEEWNDPAYRAMRFQEFGQSHDRLWVIAYQALGGVFEGQVESYMTSRFFPTLNEWHGNTRLLLFHTGRAPDQSGKAVDFDGWVRLLSYGIDPEPAEAGKSSVKAAFSWRAQKPLAGKLVVKVRLYDEAGHTWAQRDSEPQAGLMPAKAWTISETVEDRHALLVPAGTPPGEYFVGLSLTLDGKALNIVEADGNPHGQELALGRARVEKAGFTPRLESLAIQTRTSLYFGDGVEVIGYSMGKSAVKPGDGMLVNVFWRASETPKADHQAVFRIVDAGGKVVGEQRMPAGQSYSTTKWTQGEAVRDQFDLAVPAALASGVYELRLSLDDNRSFLRMDGIRVEGREHIVSPPAVTYKLASRFGDSIALTGFDLGGQVRAAKDSRTLGRIQAGDSLTLRLVWQADREVGRNLKVFSHVVEAGSRIWGQSDSIPGQGGMPTSSWVQGEYIVDTYEIALKPETPARTVEIMVGFYDPLTGVRLPTYDANGRPTGDKVILGALEVER